MSRNTSCTRALYAFAVVAAASLALSGAAAAPTVHASTLQTAPETVPPGAQFSLVPAYFHPTWSGEPWKRMCAEARGASIAIMNPNDGPGKDDVTVPDSSYTKAIEDCQGKDWRVIGYVSTRWGQRPVEEVHADIDKYKRLYPRLDGIFIDEMENDPARSSKGCLRIPPFIKCAHYSIPAQWYYSSLYQKVRQGGGQVVGNPGAAANDDWQLTTPVADIVNVIENAEEDYRGWTQPQWVYHAKHYKIAHMVYNVDPPESMTEIRTLTREKNAGFAYVTDKDNLWQDLPSDW